MLLGRHAPVLSLLLSALFLVETLSFTTERAVHPKFSEWNRAGRPIIGDGSTFRPHLRSPVRGSAKGLRAFDKSNEDLPAANERKKSELIDLISSAPRNAPTSPSMTRAVLSLVREMERLCPTPDDDVLPELAGNWELMWTAQDTDSAEFRRGPLSWINPLENQSYSNNPNSVTEGRSNPILPREIQDRLENMGILRPSGQDVDGAAVRSSQAIDTKKGQVRNLVTFQTSSLPFIRETKDGTKGSLSGSLTVDVNFVPNVKDKRKIDVKFKSCRVLIRDSPFPVDFLIPLGPVGPTGWLKTGYIDSQVRITRGHKGSVFILQRTSKKSKSR
mmetsp:Transcript_39578/g.80745  ORF Transcript_39578/g.80745 Transcript_39578/m.80745 type:complete len:331 (-) Transcript_39578:287-1279(-)